MVLIPRCARWEGGTEAHAGEGLPPFTLHASIRDDTETNQQGEQPCDGQLHALLHTDRPLNQH